MPNLNHLIAAAEADARRDANGEDNFDVMSEVAVALLEDLVFEDDGGPDNGYADDYEVILARRVRSVA